MRDRIGHMAAVVLVTAAVLAPIIGAVGNADERDESGLFDDYNQWKQAAGAGAATDAARVAVLPGFQVDLIRSAAKDEGSWVSLTFDPQGRILLAREERGLLRLTLPPTTGQPPKLETINDTLHECRGLLWAYDSLYANANNDKGLYRLRSRNGDDRLSDVKLLRATPGDVGHGRNDLVLGPDGFLYLIYGNDTQLPTDYSPAGSPYQHYAIDRPVPCEWNKQLFNFGAGPPAGHVVRTDRDGRRWDVIGGGFRNAYGIDFHPDGELFTFDADMEWDVGLPWYRPCRVNHVVSGGEYGWRQGVNKWPAWYPDSLPTTIDIGLASPTAVRFGTRSNFPPRWQKALFILDWAYGRILAIHLTPQGASYTAKTETFLRGRPLNVTDLEFGPDGAMYFTTGGRKTQSGLYRVRYVGPTVADMPPSAKEKQRDEAAAAARATRRQLETFHGQEHPQAVDAAWPHLASDDPWLRHAARVALEHQPPARWQQRALAHPETTPALTALLALARVGDAAVQARLWERIEALQLARLSPAHQIVALRTLLVSLARHGKPSAAHVTRLSPQVQSLLPSATPEVNQLAAEWLAVVESPALPPVALKLLAVARTQEERVHYLYVLRNARHGWAPGLRRQYFFALGEANRFEGARYVATTIDFIKQDALAAVPEAERTSLAALVERKPVPPPAAAANRKFVHQWKMDDLEGSLESVGRDRNLAAGKNLFHAALCNRCHRLGNEGSNLGPDLTSVAARFGRRDLLEAIISPSKVVDEKHRSALVITTDGRTVAGVIVGRDARSLHVAADPLAPDRITHIPHGDIDSQQASLVSPMPANLLDTLAKDEILDLLAYLEASATPKPSR